MTMRILAVAVAAFIAVNSTPVSADPGDPIGAAIKVVDQVTGEYDRKSRTLSTNDDVVQNEAISVSDKGLSEIVLADETKLALGPGAKLTLDKFVYDPDKTGGAIVLNMTRGAFRFITGLAKKPSYVIRTPSASITVRGTVFDVYVEQNGAIWMLLHEGEVQVCNDRGSCRVLDDPCRAVRVDGGGEVGSPGNWNGLHRDEDINFETAFPFIESPPSFDPEPRFERASIEKGTCGEQEIKPRKTRRAEPDEPRYTPRERPRKIERAEPKYEPPPKKVKRAEPKYEPPPKQLKKAEPKYDPPPKKAQKAEPKYDPPPKKKVVYVEPKKKKYDDKPKKKYRDNEKAANTAKALAIIGFGAAIAIGAGKGGGKKKGGYGY